MYIIEQIAITSDKICKNKGNPRRTSAPRHYRGHYRTLVFFMVPEIFSVCKLTNLLFPALNRNGFDEQPLSVAQIPAFRDKDRPER